MFTTRTYLIYVHKICTNWANNYSNT
uniref:Uncharacterized protein n=1 Tax=Lepeophtheirus salmonis TaxID=72036 RepID=A0A0K2ULJ0_LEPSM